MLGSASVAPDAQLASHGIMVRNQVPTGVFETAGNVGYLRAKVEHTGHTIAIAV